MGWGLLAESFNDVYAMLKIAFFEDFFLMSISWAIKLMQLIIITTYI